MKDDKTILELDNEYVLYYNEKTAQHGESLSINIFDDPSDPESSANKIGEWLSDNGGNFNKYETKVNFEKHSNLTYTPFYFKITSQTKIIDLDGKRLSKDELVKGTNIGLVARAVPYEYGGRSGVTRLLETVIVYDPKHRTQTNLEHIKELRAKRLGQKNDTNKDEDEDEGGQPEPKSIATEQSEKVTGAKSITGADEEIDASEIPF